MLIIFGVNVFRKDHGQAQRYCLQCNRAAVHELVSETAWFTLFFIPVIPLSWRLFRVRCALCGREKPEKPNRRWTLAPRRKSALFFGWLLAGLAGLWLSLVTAVYFVSQSSTDPRRSRRSISALLLSASCAPACRP
jgi:hypothetical protein